MHLDHYEAKLHNVPSLQALADGRKSRVLDDIDADLASTTHHTDWLKERGYRSSLTVPIFKGDQLAGLLFFDSKQPHFFIFDVSDLPVRCTSAKLDCYRADVI